MANGQVAIFSRRSVDGEWDFSHYWLLELAPPTVAVRCLTRVHSNVWAAFRNKIAVIDPETLRVEVLYKDCFLSVRIRHSVMVYQSKTNRGNEMEIRDNWR